MTNKEFVKKLKDIANNYKTLYVMGCFGAPMTEANKTRYINHHTYNKQTSRQKMIKAASADTFGFDCVCLIKGVLWGWNGDRNAAYGGAKYPTNSVPGGVPDISADTMITKCAELSTDFSKIEIGEAVWMSGHIGVYIGDGLAVECSPAWKNGVQITACNCNKAGYNRRNWTKHGKLPYIEYVKETAPQPVKTKTDSFFPAHGYFKKGDTHENVGKIASFMRKTFPAYTSEKALGNYYGDNLIKAITEFQRRTGLTPDGCTGPLTLAMFEKYGFKR